MSRCDEIRLALAVFGSGGSRDLPDEIVLHIEGCATCMAGFDEQFPPLQFSTPQEAVVRRPVRRNRGAVAVAAVGLLAMGMSAPQPEVDPLALMLHEESPLTIEEMFAVDQECPLVSTDSDPPVCGEDDGEWM